MRVAIEERSAVDARRCSQLTAFDRFTIGNVLARLQRRGRVARPRTSA
jgi:hypothetical protein